MGMAVRAGGAARGLASGLVAGAAWWGIEAAANWAAGGFVPPSVAADLAVLDFAIGGAAGLGMGVVAPHASRTTLALARAAVYGMMRVWAPPVSFGEAAFVTAAAGAIVLGGWLANARDDGRLRFVQLVVL